MVAVVGLSLTGCGLATSYQIANMSAGELTKVSADDVCRSGTEKNPAVLAERQKRKLGDCNPDHLYCHSLGLKPGTDLYVQCRLQARQIAAQQAAAQQAASAAMVQQGAAMPFHERWRVGWLGRCIVGAGLRAPRRFVLHDRSPIVVPEYDCLIPREGDSLCCAGSFLI